MPSEPLRVLLVDDQADMRQLLRCTLEAVCRCKVVAEATNAELAVAMAVLEQPDIIVLDHMMPGMLGADAAPTLRLVAPHARIVLCSAVADHFDLDDLPGVDALVLKGRRIGEIIEVILGDLRRSPR